MGTMVGSANHKLLKTGNDLANLQFVLLHPTLTHGQTAGFGGDVFTTHCFGVVQFELL